MDRQTLTLTIDEDNIHISRPGHPGISFSFEPEADDIQEVFEDVGQQLHIIYRAAKSKEANHGKN